VASPRSVGSKTALEPKRPLVGLSSENYYFFFFVLSFCLAMLEDKVVKLFSWPPCVLFSSKAMTNYDEKEKWFEGNNSKNLMILRRGLDLYNKDEINKVLMDYTRTVELIIAEFPKMRVESRKDWAIANARSPDWFGDALATRVQNAMLVAALLLTVTASSFLSPVGENEFTARFRITCYLNAICSALFLISIFLGICFVENGMSRAYCWSDRFC
jgi:hypothetical protein